MPESPDAELASLAVSLIHEAGQPYFDWFFGGPEAARAALTQWIARPSSEVAAGRVTVVYTNEGPAGLFIGLGGAELTTCRKSDLLAVATRAKTPEERKALIARISETKALFPSVGTEAYYLSKMAVVPHHRGQGIGRHVLDEFLAAGESEGYRRFELDVSADNERAVRLYLSAGFQKEQPREKAGMRYLRMVLTRSAPVLALALDGLERFAVLAGPVVA